jgi:protein-S-isoprenylcysteine O-methyltransferase Ste14
VSAAPPELRARSRAALAVGSLLAAGWFSLMFFVTFPALVLVASGASLWPPPGANRWLGGAILVAAHALLVGPVLAFIVEGRGTQLPIAPPGVLVRSGLYTRVRNPMYSIYFAIVLGEAVLYRSLPLLAYALAFFALEHVYVVAFEEKRLRRRFGADYDAYCERVPRWLPRRGGPGGG